MRIEINGCHLIAVAIPAAAWAFGLPWFFSVPMALILVWGVTKATSLLRTIGESDDEQ